MLKYQRLLWISTLTMKKTNRVKEEKHGEEGPHDLLLKGEKVTALKKTNPDSPASLGFCPQSCTLKM